MSSIIQQFSGKLREKLKEDDRNIKTRYAIDWFNNQRHAAILEISAEHWPRINDLKRPPAERVSDLDQLIHSTALFSGRIKQNPVFGRGMMHWENMHGAFENFMMLDLQGMEGEVDEAETVLSPVIALTDGTKIRIRMNRQNASILSQKEQLLRDALFANTEIIPFGKFVYDIGVSDDKDVSPQYVAQFTSGTGQQNRGPPEARDDGMNLSDAAKKFKDKNSPGGG